jgi:ADP-ribose pyrophosphatase YjhB (NUDIX family)
MNYCSRCGSTVTLKMPTGDDRLRSVCDACGTLHYENPKMVVGSIPVWQGTILFCRRAIEPGHGKWTLPAGFLENGETVADGAKRETFEETGAKVKDLRPYALYNLTFINQVYLMFRSRLADLDYRPGAETLEVKLFKEDDIPWDHMAFPVIRETLKLYFKDLPTGVFPFHMGTITPR